MSATTLATEGAFRRSRSLTAEASFLKHLSQPWRELHRRQAQLTTAATISLLAIVPCLLAMLVDTRTINDINIWIKPTKFLISFVVYYATLAWAFGYVPREGQSSRAGKFVIRGTIAVGLLEMTWLVLAAANGVPAHFNSGSWVWVWAYRLAGVGAVTLIVAILVQGVTIARQRSVPVAPALRWALAAGAAIAFTGTLIAAGFLSAGANHWVGGQPTDANGLALMGWSRNGGDLRVAHFFALHAQQVIPVIGWGVVATRFRRARTAVVLASAAYVALIVFTFVQALQGEPFLAFLG
jgi:hypothetical protein